MSHLAFKYPLFLLLLVPYAAAMFYYYKKSVSGEMPFAVSSEKVAGVRSSIRTATHPWLWTLRALSILLLVIALAGPGRGITYTNVETRGIDIMVALDLSGSMRAEDFQPDNRLGVAKKVVRGFIERRPGDRIGLVVFAGNAYFQCPLTIEHDIIAEIVDDLDFRSVEDNGTAIGDAVALAASRMAGSKAQSRIILLITDGMNNSGEIDPETAAKACAAAGIRVYTVGIGQDGLVPFPGPQRFITDEFNGEALEKVAAITGGKYYRAKAAGVLWQNISDIDALEKSDAVVNSYYEFESRAGVPLALGVILFFLEILLRSAVYRKLP
ncbi:MAG TPA: VWA domain-containing protein [Spirochaetota bacterium]|nr:VWA domain-containing protein [Spirochaetota bacterium]